jgi:UDP-glucuronate 4-epimerase
MHVTCLRFFTAYGAWYRPDMAMWRFTERMVKGQPLRVHVRSTEGREVRRGFTDVRDITKGVVAALDKNLPFAVINLGSADPVPLPRLVAALEQSLGMRAQVDEKVLPAEEEVQTGASLERARTLLGYAPATPLEEGVESFVTWYQNDYRQLFPNGLETSQYWGD